MLPLDLQVENSVSRLPIRFRVIIRAAAAGSPVEVQALLTVAASKPEASESLLFLPAFYANLALRRIPKTHQLDGIISIADPVMVPIANAICSLKYLDIQKHIPTEVKPRLWDRCWAWIYFIHNYSSSLPLIMPEEDLLATFLVVLDKLRGHPDVAAQIYNTPGFHVILARGWKVLLLGPEPQAHDFSLSAVSTLLAGRKPTEPHHPHSMEELLDGAGGTPAHLALLVSAHLNHFATCPPSIYSSCLLAGIVTFILNGGFDDAMHAALHSHGIIAALTRVLCAFTDGRVDSAGLPQIFHLILQHLRLHFLLPRAYEHIREAIRAGLLRAIIFCAARPRCVESLVAMVKILLPYTVYHSVLSSIEHALRDVKDLHTAPAFTRSEVFPHWVAFWELAQDRIAVMKHYESDAYVSLKACDNVKCGRIRRKRALVRCACQGPYYCSKRCQAADWKDGHRNVCRRMLLGSQSAPEWFSTRDRSFIRALLNRDYKLCQIDLLHLQVAHQHEYPDDPLCAVYFDYTAGQPTWRFARCSKLDSDWQDEVERAARSAGRIQLHFVDIVNGRNAATRVFPMQLSCGVLSEGLERLQVDLEEGIGGSAPLEEQIRGRIVGILNGVGSNTLLIH